MMNGSKWGVLCIGLALSPALGCSAVHEEPGETAAIGTARIALLGTSPSGVTYSLTDARFRVIGRTSVTLSGDEPTLEAELLAGDYLVELEEGWLLNEVRADGTLRPVEAELTTENPLAFTIVRDETTAVAFVFRVKGENVSLGTGTLGIGIDVDDGLIDDFEDGDGLVLPIGGRSGAWFVFNDETGVQLPAPTDPIVPEADPNGGLFLHTTGSGFFVFGAGLGASLAFDEDGGVVLPYDASGYGGVRFRMRSSFDARFGIGTLATTPIADGGTCVVNCFDDHQTFLGASPEWVTVEVRFDELFQLGFGEPAAFQPGEALFLKWFFGPGAPFDFAVDDVEFVP